MTDTPWRATWQAADPLRPCYTCGRPPDGKFSDGSPQYRCRSHDPINDDLEQPVWAAVPTDAEWQQARELAADIVSTDQGRGWRMYFQPGYGESRLDVNERGFAAELVASRLTGLPRNGKRLGADYKRRDKPHDIGERTEVRNQRDHAGPLYVYEADARHHLALLLTGHGRKAYVMRGWIDVADARRDEWWNESLRQPCWSVSQADLQPLPLPAGS